LKDVVDFISHFKGSEDVFLHGCCYWFAYILQKRFHEHGYLVDIFYDPIEGHFISRFIRDFDYSAPDPDEEVRFFDIRGDVTGLYKEEDLDNLWLMSLNEERRWAKLMCDCRDFIEPENYPAWIKQGEI
jgi:hypothetical protein